MRRWVKRHPDISIGIIGGLSDHSTARLPPWMLARVA